MTSDGDAFDEKVLSTFLVGGRLRSIPARHKKRGVILRYLVRLFEPGRMYEEHEVNVILRQYHEDVAALRRYLVEEGLLNRQVVRAVAVEDLMQSDNTEPVAGMQYKLMYWRAEDQGSE